MTKLKERMAGFGKILIKWEAFKLSFAIGAVFGMVAMAVLLTSATALAGLTGLVGPLPQDNRKHQWQGPRQ